MKLINAMLLLLVALLFVTIAYATQPALASGGFKVVNIVPGEVRNANGNSIVTFTVTFDLTGDFNGVFVEDVRQELRSTGKGTFQGQGTFSGTVNGASGSADIRVVGTIDGSEANGQITILNGTGGLVNLRGQGNFNQTGNTGIYSVQIHFDPK